MRDRIVPIFSKKPGRTSNLRILLPEIGLAEKGRETNTLLPSVTIFAVAMGTAAKQFTVSRIFTELFPDMFEVRVYDGIRIVKLTNPNLPPLDTDPPPS